MADNRPPATVTELITSVTAITNRVQQHRQAMAEVAATVKADKAMTATAMENKP